MYGRRVYHRLSLYVLSESVCGVLWIVRKAYRNFTIVLLILCKQSKCMHAEDGLPESKGES